VVFLATLIRSSFGFGEALVAVPLLSLRLPVQVAVPLAVLLSITVAGMIVAQDWRHVQWRSAGSLVFFTLFGIPIGIELLKVATEGHIKMALAIVLIGFSLYSLLGRMPARLKSDRWIWLAGFGFAAGVFGGAFGMNGPPLVIYGSLRRWKPARFRATLQAYFLPASAVGFICYWAAGLWVAMVTRYYLLSLPMVILAVLLGRIVNRRLRGRSFFAFVYLGLIVIGVTLLVQAVSR